MCLKCVKLSIAQDVIKRLKCETSVGLLTDWYLNGVKTFTRFDNVNKMQIKLINDATTIEAVNN